MATIPSRIAGSVLAIGLAGVAIGCNEPAPLRPAPASVESANMAPLTWPTSDTAFPIPAELAEIRRATARFHNISAAYAAGYTTENEPCVSSPAGGMGIHAPNVTLLLDPAVDPARPELLLYEPKANGSYKLVGVEYFQAVVLRNLETQAEAPRFESTPWDPAEFAVLNPPPELFGQTFHLSPPPAPGVPWHYALHVWVWARNPSGVFADWNPRVRCP